MAAGCSAGSGRASLLYLYYITQCAICQEVSINLGCVVGWCVRTYSQGLRCKGLQALSLNAMVFPACRFHISGIGVAKCLDIRLLAFVCGLYLLAYLVFFGNNA